MEVYARTFLVFFGIFPEKSHHPFFARKFGLKITFIF
jgi:hypothetical protein